MAYLKSSDITVIALSASLWGVLNSTLSPLIFQISGLPILCDILGFSILSMAVWRIRKLGTATAVGSIATLINFILNPAGVVFLGFTVASVFFDLVMWLVRYDRVFKKAISTAVSVVLLSALSAAVAGAFIGAFFMATPTLIKWGGVGGWAALHIVGGVVGGVLGVVLISSVISGGIAEHNSRLGTRITQLHASG